MVDEDNNVQVVNSEKKYTVSFGLKLPIPGVNYSSVQSMISISGDDYEEIKDEAFVLLEQQTLALLNSVESVFNG